MIEKTLNKSEVQPQYAGFFIRGLALAIDWTIIYLPVALAGLASILLLIYAKIRIPTSLGFYIGLCAIFIPTIYFIYAHGGKQQSTLGKRMCNIYVGNSSDGSRINYLQSAFRFIFLGLLIFVINLEKLIPSIKGQITVYFLCAILLLPFVLAAFNKEKAGLHDRLLMTRVYLRSPDIAGDSFHYNYFNYFSIISILLLIWGALFPLVKSPSTSALILKTFGAASFISLLALLLLSSRLKGKRPLRLILNETGESIKLLLFSLIPSVILYSLLYYLVFGVKK